jgi:hypothetical protein
MKKYIFCLCYIVLIGVEAFAMDQFKLTEVNGGLLKGFITMIDTNLPTWLLLGACSGAVLGQGDLRQRATTSGIGASTAMIIWAIGKKMAGL